MLTTFILIGLACLLVYFLILPERKNYHREENLRRAGRKTSPAEKSAPREKKTDGELKMPAYYEEIVETDRLKKTYLDLHESI